MHFQGLQGALQFFRNVLQVDVSGAALSSTRQAPGPCVAAQQQVLQTDISDDELLDVPLAARATAGPYAALSIPVTNVQASNSTTLHPPGLQLPATNGQRLQEQLQEQQQLYACRSSSAPDACHGYTASASTPNGLQQGFRDIQPAPTHVPAAAPPPGHAQQQQQQHVGQHDAQCRVATPYHGPGMQPSAVTSHCVAVGRQQTQGQAYPSAWARSPAAAAAAAAAAAPQHLSHTAPQQFGWQEQPPQPSAQQSRWPEQPPQPPAQQGGWQAQPPRPSGELPSSWQCSAQQPHPLPPPQQTQHPGGKVTSSPQPAWQQLPEHCQGRPGNAAGAHCWGTTAAANKRPPLSLYGASTAAGHQQLLSPQLPSATWTAAGHGAAPAASTMHATGPSCDPPYSSTWQGTGAVQAAAAVASARAPSAGMPSLAPKASGDSRAAGRSDGGQARKPLLAKLLSSAAEAGEGGSAPGASSSRWPWLSTERKDVQGRAPGSPGYDPSTLQLPPPAVFSQLSDIAQQFWRIKAQAMDVVLFVKHGSFYNLFDVDADVGLRVGLNLSGNRTPNMWKVGCHKDVFPQWATKVLALGCSVGRVEELPAGSGTAASGSSSRGSKLLVRRLVKIYTPGMSVEGIGADNQASGGAQSILFLVEHQQDPKIESSTGHATAAASSGNGSGVHLGSCLLDLASGQCLVGGFADTHSRGGLATLLMRHQPAAVMAVRHSLSSATQRVLQLHCRQVDQDRLQALPPLGGAADSGPVLLHLPTSLHSPQLAASAQQLLSSRLQAGALQALQQCLVGQPWSNAAVQAVVTAVLQVVRCGVAEELLDTLQVSPLELQPAAAAAGAGATAGQSGPAAARTGTSMHLDDRALTVLEVLEGSLGGRAGSLLAALDRCVTGPGTRRLRSWLCRPLTLPSQIEERLGVVDLFHHHPAVALELQGQLLPLPDPEHLLPRAAAALQQLLPSLQQYLDTQQHKQLLSPELCMGAAGSLNVMAHSDGHHQRQQQPLHQAAAALTCSGLAVADAGLDPSDCSWAAVAKASVQKAVQQLPECLASYVDAVALLQHTLTTQLQLDTATLPLLHRAVLAAAAAAPVLAEAAPIFSGLYWSDCTGDALPSAGPPEQQLKAARKSRKQPGLPQAPQQQQCSALQTAAGQVPVTSGNQQLSLQQGVCPQYDAATQLAAAAATALQAAVEQEAACYRACGGALLVDASAGLMQVQTTAVAADCVAPRHQVLQVAPDGSRPAPGSCFVVVPDLKHLATQQSAARAAATAALAEAVSAAAQLLLDHYSQLQQLIWAVAELDVLAGFAAATTADQAPPGCSFCRPCFTASAPAAGPAELWADGLWHVLLGQPCSSTSNPDSSKADPGSRLAAGAGVVPNDLHLGGPEGHPAALLLTGANTGGKSTLLRATAVAAIMAQVGCYVPAAQFHLTPLDAIFTRIGAHDRIMAQQSTFMVEMVETSSCLSAATPASLVILDELGRGTSTHDGYALAFAVLQHLVTPHRGARGDETLQDAGDTSKAALGPCCRQLNPPGRSQQQQQPVLAQLIANSSRGSGSLGLNTLAFSSRSSQRQQLLAGPRLLFATHYHGLTHEPSLQGRVQVAHMAVHLAACQDQLLPLYQLRHGPAPQGSCGVLVAAAAGLPQGVVQRAAQVTAALNSRVESRILAAP